MRLIDADLLEKEIYKWMPKDQETWMEGDIPPIENLVVSIMMTIQEQPTVDAVPARHGTWAREVLGSTSGYGTTVMYQCSECEKMSISEHKYCPNCGARMDERKEE